MVGGAEDTGMVTKGITPVTDTQRIDALNVKMQDMASQMQTMVEEMSKRQKDYVDLRKEMENAEE